MILNNFLIDIKQAKATNVGRKPEIESILWFRLSNLYVSLSLSLSLSLSPSLTSDEINIYIYIYIYIFT